MGVWQGGAASHRLELVGEVLDPGAHVDEGLLDASVARLHPLEVGALVAELPLPLVHLLPRPRRRAAGEAHLVDRRLLLLALLRQILDPGRRVGGHLDEVRVGLLLREELLDHL